MTPEKVKEVTAEYRKFLSFAHEKNWTDNKFDLARTAPRGSEAFDHVKWMLDRIDEFADQGRMGKAFRWLGFLQGVFWTLGTYTLDQMREHNRTQ